MANYPLKIDSNFLFIHGRDLDSLNQLYVESTGVFCFGYRFTDLSDEIWTTRISKFKDGNSVAVSKLSKLIGIRVKELKHHIHGRCVCVGIIGHQKRSLASDDPVYVLGQEVSENLEIVWKPDLIQKKPHKSLHEGRLTRSQRDKIVHGCYSINNSLDSNLDSLVIVDDICTTGASYKECIRAIKMNYPDLKRCICISAGKAEKCEFHESRGISLDNTHIPEEYHDLWRTL